MPKPKKPEGFAVTRYSHEYSPQDKFAIIYQIVNRMTSDNPACGLMASLSGDLLRLTYSSYEMMAPTRMRQIEDAGKQFLDSAVKTIKKEFKSQVGKPLDLKEKKEMADSTIQKVSLNERYTYSSWRFYEIGDVSTLLKDKDKGKGLDGATE